MAVHGHPKVVYFDTNPKRVCNFLSVVNSNVGPILPRFRDIAIATPPLIHAIFGMAPLDYIADVGIPRMMLGLC